MIGKVCTSTVEYFDTRTNCTRLKSRPVLIIGELRNNDYTVLPISTISRPENRDPDYDIPIIPADYPALNLGKPCFVRTHKQCFLHMAALHRPIGDMKTDYPDLYRIILEKWEAFHRELAQNALPEHSI